MRKSNAGRPKGKDQKCEKEEPQDRLSAGFCESCNDI